MKKETTATTQAQETKAPVNQTAQETKQETKKSTTAGKSTKDSKTSKPAPKKPAPKKNTKKAEQTAEERKKSFYTDESKNIANLLTVKAVAKAQNVNGEYVLMHGAEVAGKEAVMPKCIEAGQLDNFSRLVQGKCFDYQTDKLESASDKLKATIQKSETGTATDEQKNVLDSYKDAKATIAKLRTKYNTGKAEYVTDPLAMLIACYKTGVNLPIETTALKSAMKRNYEAMHAFMVEGAKNGTATMNEEDKKAVADLRKALVDTMTVFCQKTTWCKGFTLSASASDAVEFYERAFVKEVDGTPKFIWDTAGKESDMRELHTRLAEWLFRKMKAEF